MNSFKNNSAIVYALLARDMKVIKKRLPTLLVDGSITIIIAVIIWGTLFPLLGMPGELTAPIFIGSSLLFLLASLGNSHALRNLFDLKTDRFIDYLITLPLPKVWLFIYFTISSTLESFIVTIPLITIGIVLLGEAFGHSSGNFMSFFCFYLLALIFWALFFINATYTYSYHWFKNNIWARRIMPLFTCGPAFYTWAQVEHVSPILSRLMLINPVTYLTEGLRSSLLGGTHYIPWYYCSLAVIFFCILLCININRSIYKQLDPV